MLLLLSKKLQLTDCLQSSASNGACCMFLAVTHHHHHLVALCSMRRSADYFTRLDKAICIPLVKMYQMALLQHWSITKLIMRPSSLGGAAYCVALCLSVWLSVRPVIVTERHVAPPSELQWHTCTFRHAQRAAYRTAISAAQACFRHKLPIKPSYTGNHTYEKCLVTPINLLS